jgi:hypothetical protein
MKIHRKYRAIHLRYRDGYREINGNAEISEGNLGASGEGIRKFVREDSDISMEKTRQDTGKFEIDSGRSK